jgi:glycosyltransferase involved in cell wall biosynthesis
MVASEALVTVVVPTYRRQDMLLAALESALSQTYAEVEIVVSVDGDDEETAQLVGRLDDPRVRSLWDGRRRGEASNTVRGIESGRGAFFAILHDDDEWLPTMLEELVGPLRADPSIAVSFADHYVMDVEGAVDVEATEANSRSWQRADLPEGKHQPFYRQALIDKTIPSVMTAVYRRSEVDVKDVPAGLPANFDYWLSWLAVKGGGGVHYTPRRLSRYRVHDGSGTAKAQAAWAEAHVMIYERLTAEAELADLLPLLRQRLAESRRRAALYRRATGRPGAVPLAATSFRDHPSAKAASVLLLCLGPARLVNALMDSRRRLAASRRRSLPDVRVGT